MPHVRILSGSQAGAIDEQDPTTASVSVATGYAEYVEAINGRWEKVEAPAPPSAALAAPAPKPAAKPAKPPKPRK